MYYCCYLSTHLTILIFFISCRAPSYSLFPYTTLFRSQDFHRFVAVFMMRAFVLARDYKSCEDVCDSDRGVCGVDVLSTRSEEHTSELQSRGHLVCRLLLAKKNSNLVNGLTFLLRGLVH